MKFMNSLRLAFAVAFAAILSACLGDSHNGGPSGTARYVAAVGLGNSAFVTPFESLEGGAITNTHGFEVGTFNYTFARGNVVLVTQNLQSDVVRKFVRNASGKLVDGGSLTLPNASSPGDVAFAGDTAAYIGLYNSGKIAVIDPRSMQLRRYIDLTGSRYAVGDSNPDPGNLLIHRGKLWVTLMQQKNLYEAHKRVDVLVINPANDSVEHHLVDSTSGLAQAGYMNRQNLLADEQGDLYVYCIASAGYYPGQSHGFRRVKAGSWSFDPDYVLNFTHGTFAVPGGAINHFNTMTYAGNGIAYGAGNVPALASNPPDYINDKTYYVVKIDLHAKTTQVLPLPPSNGYAGFVYAEGGKVYAALTTSRGSGLFRYDPATGNADSTPFITTQGYVNKIVSLGD